MSKEKVYCVSELLSVSEESSGMNEKCDEEPSSSRTEEKTPKRTLMDVARSECFQPPKKKNEHFSRIGTYL